MQQVTIDCNHVFSAMFTKLKNPALLQVIHSGFAFSLQVFLFPLKDGLEIDVNIACLCSFGNGTMFNNVFFIFYLYGDLGLIRNLC